MVLYCRCKHFLDSSSRDSPPNLWKSTHPIPAGLECLRSTTFHRPQRLTAGSFPLHLSQAQIVSAFPKSWTGPILRYRSTGANRFIRTHPILAIDLLHDETARGAKVYACHLSIDSTVSARQSLTRFSILKARRIGRATGEEQKKFKLQRHPIRNQTIHVSPASSEETVEFSRVVARPSQCHIQ